MSFDAWGKRREVAWAAFLPVPASLWQTQPITRGFTGHEQLDPVGLVHMNGRVYDPELGRFLSADPHIQDVTNGQALNRYSYVLNNPLSFTDPSGFFFQSLFKAIGHAVGAVFRAIGRVFSALLKSSIFRSIVQIAACTFGGPPGCAVASAGLTLASGGSIQDAFMAAAFSVASAYIYTEVGDFLDGAGAFEKLATHGVVGGALEVAQGGEFHTGFVTGAIGKASSLATESSELGSIPGVEGKFIRTAIAATAGGTASELTGGKFANGAITAAFAHLYNQEATRPRPTVTSPFDILFPGTAANNAWRSWVESFFNSASSASGSTEGIAIIHKYDQHVSIEVKIAAESLHTEQVVLKSMETTIEVSNSQSSPYFTVTLPNATAAMAYSKSMIGVPTGPYDRFTNSCVTYCGDVLRAGGVNVPRRTTDLMRFFRGEQGR